MINQNLLFAGDDGYNLTKSLRFRSSASAYMNRTPSTSGNLTTWTFSCWIKRGTLGVRGNIFHAYDGSAGQRGEIYFDTNNNLVFYKGGTGTPGQFTSNAVFRDPAAWYHIVIVANYSNATSANRALLYVNGVAQSVTINTTFDTSNGQINGNWAHSIASQATGQYFDGYMAEVNFIDGQALTPSSFGSTNALTGVWQPAKYTGTYGTNGFYLPFTNTASTTALGYDSSGNGNNWTTNNFSISSNSTYDSMTDVPTLTSATTANYCTINPLLDLQSYATYSNGNLTVNTTAATGYAMRMLSKGTMSIPSTGKWYFTMYGSNCQIMIGCDDPNRTQYGNILLSTYVAYTNAGAVTLNGTTVTTVDSFTSSDEVGLAIDMGASTVGIYKNGALLYTVTSAITSTFTYYPMTSTSSSSTTYSASWNFGQQPFAYTPPTGFIALNTYNLPTSTIVKGNTVMDATTYAGNNGTQSVTNTSNFKPDLVWVKNRTNGYTHLLYDSVRGAGTLKAISSSETTAEGGMSDNSTYGYLSALNSNGFTVVSGSTANSYTNSSSNNYVGWQWQAGKGSTSSNTNGSITSTVSVNASAGFSVVTYTGTAANATVGHGLGVAPSMIITKNRDSSTAWWVYHASLGNTKYLVLNTALDAVTSTSAWNNTSPTSSVFSLGAASPSNANQDVAYCFAPIAGYSAFGSYTGNGDPNGPFIYLGFRPKFVMVKNASTTTDWKILDSARNTYNPEISLLAANVYEPEDTSSSYAIDFLSNGFKVRETFAYANGSGNTIVYMAFAENPFKYALAR